LAHSQASQENACVVMADIDHFKRVNDQFGHLVGDEVLRRVADRIKKSLRQNDAVGRYGGEEFLIVLGAIDLIRAREIAERIRLHVADDALRLSSAFVSVTISLGISQVTADDSVESAIERADRAMYLAKSNGRNRVELG
jgi:diguanylate cyclase (GGDEF)-like protein